MVAARGVESQERRAPATGRVVHQLRGRLAVRLATSALACQASMRPGCRAAEAAHPPAGLRVKPVARLQPSVVARSDAKAMATSGSGSSRGGGPAAHKAADMLGGAGKSALGAVATGLMVNNPQEMSRVTRLLYDMVVLPCTDAPRLALLAPRLASRCVCPLSNELPKES